MSPHRDAYIRPSLVPFTKVFSFPRSDLRMTPFFTKKKKKNNTEGPWSLRRHGVGVYLLYL